jgi:DNA-binding HxlR family transcriptional regulator
MDALSHPGAAMLLVLAENEATEAELLVDLDATSQATANRRLTELERLGVIARDQGKRKAPGRRWRLSAPEPTETLLQAALHLADVLAESERRNRAAAQRRLRLARAKRLGIRKADQS